MAHVGHEGRKPGFGLRTEVEEKVKNVRRLPGNRTDATEDTGMEMGRRVGKGRQAKERLGYGATQGEGGWLKGRQPSP